MAVEIKIEKHELEDWTPAEAFKWFCDAGTIRRDHREKAETLRSGDIEGSLYRTVERNREGYRFLWAWDCATCELKFYDTPNAARIDLVDRIKRELRHIKEKMEEAEQVAPAQEREELAVPDVSDDTASASTAEPELEVEIKRHKLSDRTPEEVFAVQRKISESFRAVEVGEIVETVTIGPETGEIARYAVQHKGTVVFRWTWSSYDYEEEAFETLKHAREDLIERLRYEIEFTKQDLERAKTWAAAKSSRAQ